MKKDNTTVVDAESKLKNFNSLLDDIVTLSDKKKKLWIEIYQNAILDRQNAYAMFVQLVEIAQNKSSEHAVHGKTIATYIERMSKANDQLIKLAELVARAEEKNDDINPDDMYGRLNGGN